MLARLLSLPVLLALGLACQSSPPPAARHPAGPAARTQAFDAQRAWAHLSALAEIGPRAMGTEGVRRAGEYILGELGKLDLELVEQEFTVRRGEQDEQPLSLRNLAAKIPGRSSDIFLLIAPYDTRHYESFRFLGVNDGGSGAALLLEIARVLAADPLPYTTWLVFLDGEAPRAPSSVPVAPPSAYGSRVLAKHLAEQGVLPAVRLALVVNRVCDTDLRVARDLLSHRIYREEFWRAAARLGRSDAFPPDARFESPMASHQALVAVGLRRVVALVDTSFGGDEPPGLYAGTEDDDLEHCSADSLETVGKVALEALDKISRRLAKIDRFAQAPLEAPGELTFELPMELQVHDTAGAQTGEEGAPPSEAEGKGEGTQAAPGEPKQAAPEMMPAPPSAPGGEEEAKQAAPEVMPAPPSEAEGKGEGTQAAPGEPTEAAPEVMPAPPSAQGGEEEAKQAAPEVMPAPPSAPGGEEEAKQAAPEVMPAPPSEAEGKGEGTQAAPGEARQAAPEVMPPPPSAQGGEEEPKQVAPEPPPEATREEPLATPEVPEAPR